MKTISNKLTNIIDDMNVFINDTLKSLNHVVSGTLSPEDLVVCSMDQCVNDTVDNYPFTNNDKRLVERHLEHSFSFRGNQVLFMRVLFNLLNNSLYQIRQCGKGKIIISTEAGPGSNLLRFKDTAGGMTPLAIKSFFSGYETTKKDGTGIGLAFCKLTMKSFGGDITCHIVEGDCVEFVLSFPAI